MKGFFSRVSSQLLLRLKVRSWRQSTFRPKRAKNQTVWCRQKLIHQTVLALGSSIDKSLQASICTGSTPTSLVKFIKPIILSGGASILLYCFGIKYSFRVKELSSKMQQLTEAICQHFNHFSKNLQVLRREEAKPILQIASSRRYYTTL